MKPNFFIIGAPKCGTTSLSEYLRYHPHILMSDPKEPHYFADDFPAYQTTKTQEQYLALFQDSNSAHQAIGEASALYLYSANALKNLANFNSNAKIIVMLRNPVDMVYSYHSQLVYDGDENESNFEKAWQLQSLRQQGHKISNLCREPRLLQYAEFGKLGQQVARLLTIFDRQQIHIVWFEDFIQDPELSYRQVLDFLEVPIVEKQEFERANPNKKHQLSWLGKFTEKPPKFLVDSAMKAKKILGISELGLMSKIRGFNTKVIKRKPLSQKLRTELVTEFFGDIKELSSLLDKDLSHWL